LRANQRDGYAVLMKAAAEAIIDWPAIAATSAAPSACSRFSTPGPNSSIITRTYIASSPVAASPLTAAIGTRRRAKGYLFPERALAKLVRGKLKALLARGAPT